MHIFPLHFIVFLDHKINSEFLFIFMQKLFYDSRSLGDFHMEESMDIVQEICLKTTRSTSLQVFYTSIQKFLYKFPLFERSNH